MRGSIWVLTAVLLAWESLATGTAQKAVTKRPNAVRTVKRTSSKPDPVATLAARIYRNSIEPGANLYDACISSNTKALMFGLDGFFHKRDLSKGEFETEGTYQTRIGGLEGALAGDRELIVCQYLDDNEDVLFQYDAEKQAFSGSFDTRLRADLDWKKTGTYVSKTRMGARATVTSYFGIDYFIDMSAALARPTAKCVDGGYTSMRFTVPVPIGDAPALKANGYLVILGGLANPFYSRTETTGNPTLDDPSDISQVTMTATLRPRALYVVGPGGKAIWECQLRLSDAVEQAKLEDANLFTKFWTADDYPASAIRENAEGTVKVRLTFVDSGRVGDCVVLSSSGRTDLDRATCQIAVRRVHVPASSLKGRTTIEHTVRWTLPT